MWNELPVQVQCRIQDAWGWCTGTTQRDGTGREVWEGFRMGNTCTPMADSCRCIAKPIQYCKVISLQYFGHLMRRVDSLKRLWCWRDWGQEEKGTTEEEVAGWHHWLDGRASQWTLGVGDGQGGLVCWDSWGPEVSDTTERLNWINLQ